MLSAAALVRQFVLSAVRQATGCGFHAKALPTTHYLLDTRRLTPGSLQSQPHCRWPGTNPADARTEALRKHSRQLQLAMDAAQQQHCSQTSLQQQWTSQQEHFMHLAFEQVRHTAAGAPAPEAALDQGSWWAAAGQPPCGQLADRSYKEATLCILSK